MRRQDGGVPSQWRRAIVSATGGGQVARWKFHFLVGGPRHPGRWQGRLARRAIVPLGLFQVRSTNSKYEVPSRRSPGSLGSLVRLGQGTGHAKRPSAYLAIGPPPIRGAGRAANVPDRRLPVTTRFDIITL